MIGVTAATGQFGRLVLERLAGRGDVVAIARDPQKAADLEVPVRIADYALAIRPRGRPRSRASRRCCC